MAALVLDTSFVYNLAADRTFSTALFAHTADGQLFVPSGVLTEVQYRLTTPTPSLPRELVSHAVGMITSSNNHIQVERLSESEVKEAWKLAERIGGEPGKNVGEAECAVLATRLRLAEPPTTSVIVLDDRAAQPVLNRYMLDSCGSNNPFTGTPGVLQVLVRKGRLTGDEASQILANLQASGRSV